MDSSSHPNPISSSPLLHPSTPGGTRHFPKACSQELIGGRLHWEISVRKVPNELQPVHSLWDIAEALYKSSLVICRQGCLGLSWAITDTNMAVTACDTVLGA